MEGRRPYIGARVHYIWKGKHRCADITDVRDAGAGEVSVICFAVDSADKLDFGWNYRARWMAAAFNEPDTWHWIEEEGLLNG